MGSVIPTINRAAAIERLRRVERFALDGATVGDMTAGCLLLDVVDGGRAVGAVALDIVGKVATITATARAGEIGPDELAQVETIARREGADTLKFWTRRPALVRSMQRAGFELVSAEMEKAI